MAGQDARHEWHINLRIKMYHLFPHFLGYAFAIFIGHYFVYHLVERLWKSIGESNPKRPGMWLPEIIGHVERPLYVAALSSDASAFIGVWLVLKVAGNWSAWKDGITQEQKDGIIQENKRLEGHTIFNIFVIGNGASIAYAMVGALFIANGWNGLNNSCAAAGALIFGTTALLVRMIYLNRRSRSV
jgi:hypothetical protein